jgi:hypothetical protein
MARVAGAQLRGRIYWSEERALVATMNSELRQALKILVS